MASETKKYSLKGLITSELILFHLQLGHESYVNTIGSRATIRGQRQAPLASPGTGSTVK